jgi:hypothetical protein
MSRTVEISLLAMPAVLWRLVSIGKLSTIVASPEVLAEMLA